MFNYSVYSRLGNKSKCDYGGNTTVLSSAVDQVGTSKNGFPPRIKASDRSIMVNDTKDIGCRPIL